MNVTRADRDRMVPPRTSRRDITLQDVAPDVVSLGHVPDGYSRWGAVRIEGGGEHRLQ